MKNIIATLIALALLVTACVSSEDDIAKMVKVSCEYANNPADSTVRQQMQDVSAEMIKKHGGDAEWSAEAARKLAEAEMNGCK